MGERRTATIVLALACLLVTATPTAGTFVTSTVRSAPDGSVHSLVPPPGAVVPATTTTIEAWVRADAVQRIDVSLDGVRVPSRVGEPRQDWGVPVRADADLTTGEHRLQVTYEDDSGVHERTWHVGAFGDLVDRVAGSDRYATAAAISRRAFPADDSALAAVVARGDAFADGLAGAPLAAAVDGPLLLSASASLSDVTATELRRALPAGATVYLLGGETALSSEVERDVVAMGLRPQRLGGGTRYATAARIAAELPPSDDAFVVSGTSFADALSASVPAARDGVPILLTDRDVLPTVTLEALSERGARQVTIVGGEAAVSTDVQAELQDAVGTVRRLYGADRYATAVAVADVHDPDATEVALASGQSFADALAGASWLAADGRPLLLTRALDLPTATLDALRTRRSAHVVVLGGASAIADATLMNARSAGLDDLGGPHVTAVDPGPGTHARWLDDVRLRSDADLGTTATYTLSVEGREVPVGTTRPSARDVSLAPRAPLDIPYDTPQRFVLHADVTDADGRRARTVWTFTLAVADPYFGDAGPVPLFLPSRDVELIGFHQSTHDGARQIAPRGTSTAMFTMDSRGRGTGSRSAADIVANPDLPVYAPATGRVLRAGTYTLYCDHRDHYLVIEPDAAPGWEVKMLHFEGLAVAAGDRVTAGRTKVGSRPRVLPFESQVDEASDERNWPHVHVEVVDPSIPDRPGGGC